MRDLKELPITEESGLGDISASAAAVAQGLQRVPSDTKEMAYQAWLGFYNSQSRLPWNKEQLVRAPPCVSCVILTLSVHRCSRLTTTRLSWGFRCPLRWRGRRLAKWASRMFLVCELIRARVAAEVTSREEAGEVFGSTSEEGLRVHHSCSSISKRPGYSSLSSAAGEAGQTLRDKWSIR